MASSKKPREEEKKTDKKKSKSIPVKDTKKAIKKPENKPSASEKSKKSKPKPKLKSENDKNKSSNGTQVESEVISDPSSSSESEEQENGNSANRNVKPNKRKRKETLQENEEAEESDEGEELEAKMCRFPMNRIKRIIKSEDSRIAVPKDVVFIVNKATEKFLEKFSEDGYKAAVEDRKKSLSYKHLSTVVHKNRKYDFLSDYVPEKIKAEDALKERNMTEPGTE